MRVIRNKVLVDILNNEDKTEYTTKSGLYVSSRGNGTARLVRARVKGKGTGIVTNSGIVPIDVNTGDEVLFYLPSATKFKYNNKEYVVIRAEDIEVVLEGGDIDE